ncbi:hypothetical protein [Colwellia piezophila]|uniref:hypothetical protein n=1 Tax=Colwellia piezophila TaxID=211668 RepID=UPI0003661DEF|nr:hypothetical protein [Colwellia piezophila]
MKRTSVLISNLMKASVEGQQRISAEVDGELLWFDFPNHIEVEARGELFIAASLLEAMISNLPIKLDDNIPVSPTLLQSLDELQDIYICWNSDLSKVEVQVSNIQAPINLSQGVGSFYSGGVDSSYTFCKHQEEITHLITLAGFDTISKQDQWSNLVEKKQTFANEFNIDSIIINNNLRQFSNSRKISFLFQHGLTLAGIGISLGFEKVYIPSSFTYTDMFPWGSHPCTDPLWSIENRRLVHDGAEVSRSDKIVFISSNQFVLDNIQVCWNNIAHNCDTCSKCLRTRAALHIYQLTSKSLQHLSDINELKSLTLTSQAVLPFIQDLSCHAREKNLPELSKVFSVMIRKYLLKYHFEGFVKALFGNGLKKLVHKFRKTEWKKYRVTMEGHKRDNE